MEPATREAAARLEADPAGDALVTAVVRRLVKPGAEGAFEAAMQDFIRFALAFPGNRGIHVVRPDGSSRHYTGHRSVSTNSFVHSEPHVPLGHAHELMSRHADLLCGARTTLPRKVHLALALGPRRGAACSVKPVLKALLETFPR